MLSDPPFSESNLRAAVAGGVCWSDALRTLGYEPKGHNIRTLQRWTRTWEISTEHFDPDVARVRSAEGRRQPLEQVMVENSSYPRKNLKKRLLASGLKTPVCEICGQDDIWQGKRMTTILDHINGVPTDHRLENLRIVVPTARGRSIRTPAGTHRVSELARVVGTFSCLATSCIATAPKTAGVLPQRPSRAGSRILRRGRLSAPAMSNCSMTWRR
jgi:hypothetical protein